MNRIIKQLRLEGKEFTTSDELREYSRKLYYNYENVKRYLISQGYLIRIFKGIFYIKNFDEKKLGRVKYSLLELVEKGLRMKGIKNFYFGLYTALKLNEIPHKKNGVIYLISDSLFRSNPIKIHGQKFKLIKLKPDLCSFGVIENKIGFSDPEKTLLDFIYLWKYSGMHEMNVVRNLTKYIKHVSKEKLFDYVKYYPKTNKEILEKLFPLSSSTTAS